MNEVLQGYINPEQSRAFQDLLRNARTRLGKTQTEVAQEAGVTQTMISTFERGPHTGMRVIDLFKVLKYYGIEPNEVAKVLGLFPEDPELDSADARRLSQLFDALSRLDANERGAIEDAIDLMIRGVNRRSA